METNLTVTAIQSKLYWEDPKRNRTHLEAHFKKIDTPTDIVVLPEMFSTGFSMQSNEFAETINGPTVEWMRHWSKKMNFALAGSLIFKAEGQIYNRFLFVSPSGEIMFYDKRHTFTLAKEHLAYAKGKNDGLITYKGWKICLRVCYDLRFPVWSRNTNDYHLLIYTANWPHTRIDAWDTLLKARAIENMSYCMGVNRVGTDGSHLEYPGHSAIYDYMGTSLAHIQPKHEGFCTAVLSKEKLQTVRKKLPFLSDRDNFTFEG